MSIQSLRTSKSMTHVVNAENATTSPACATVTYRLRATRAGLSKPRYLIAILTISIYVHTSLLNFSPQVTSGDDNDVLLLHATNTGFDGNILHMKASAEASEAFNFIYAETDSK